MTSQYSVQFYQTVFKNVLTCNAWNRETKPLKILELVSGHLDSRKNVLIESFEDTGNGSKLVGSLIFTRQ